MKKLTYQCDDCEDTEEWSELLPEDCHCDCGGHLRIVKTDNFLRISPFSDCDICQNFGTVNCVDCNHKGGKP